MIAYSHTQRSPVLPPLGTGVIALIIGVAVFSGGDVLAVGVVLIAGALVALLALIFSRLTVDVADDHVRVAFGAGWPARTIPFSAVVTATAVRNKWYMGWGIRWLPRGMLWNVWGLDAVELQLGTGRRFRIGGGRCRHIE